ncbi:MAG: glutamine synthetase [Parasporobacterium sp.]|nr:glutamine synthetase [Parasporobacterium sp.]
MKYSVNEVKQYIAETEVKFIRLAFCDIYGNQKNIAIMPGELDRAFEYGISIDASSIAGFKGDVRSDLILRPDPSTLSILPWRPESGRVVRMFCDITYPDGRIFDADMRNILKKTVEKAESKGISFSFGTEMEFYIFKTDENGDPTKIPYDKAGYMDVAPDDKGENIRREICLTLEQMSIIPESSHHEEGPGQNEIDFRYSDPVTTADNAVTFKSVVKTIANRNGLYADFSPKPLRGYPGNGMHINISVKNAAGTNCNEAATAGIMKRISEITVFLNPDNDSYERLGGYKAPSYISWSSENRSQLIRIPAAVGQYERAELRSADCMTNPYIALALLMEAAMEGIENQLTLPAPADLNLFNASMAEVNTYKKLPGTLQEAKNTAASSEFIKSILPAKLIEDYCM